MSSSEVTQCRQCLFQSLRQVAGRTAAAAASSTPSDSVRRPIQRVPEPHIPLTSSTVPRYRRRTGMRSSWRHSQAMQVTSSRRLLTLGRSSKWRLTVVTDRRRNPSLELTDRKSLTYLQHCEKHVTNIKYSNKTSFTMARILFSQCHTIWRAKSCQWHKVKVTRCDLWIKSDAGMTNDYAVARNLSCQWGCASGKIVRVMSWREFWNVQIFFKVSRLVTTKLSCQFRATSWTVRKLWAT